MKMNIYKPNECHCQENGCCSCTCCCRSIRGATGATGPAGDSFSTAVLNAVDADVQQTGEGTALTFGTTPLVRGDALVHADGDAEVVILESGVYLAIFHGVVLSDDCTTAGQSLTMRLRLDGEQIAVGIAHHVFPNIRNSSGVTLHAAFEVGDCPARLTVHPDSEGFRLVNGSVTVIRLADRNR